MSALELDTQHPNPLLCPGLEKNCPVCRAAAVHWKPDLANGTFVAAFDCDCQFDSSAGGRGRWIDATSAMDHLYRLRWRMVQRLGRDYSLMADRSFQTGPGNLDAAKAISYSGANDRVFLHGASGRGKTHLAIQKALQLFNQGVSVEYWPEQAFFEDAQQYVLSKNPLKTKPGRSGDVLILDDLGKTRPTEYAAQMLYDVLEFRVSNNLGFLITSNHSPEEVARRMVLDPKNANAVASRLHSGLVLELVGEDRRGGAR